MSVTVEWLRDRTFVGTDSGKHSVVISSAGDGVGMKPSELLLVSLASCTAYDVVGILEKKRQNVTGLQIEVQAEQEPEPPWPFTRIHMVYKIQGTPTEKAVEKAIEISETKYCSVAATLKGVAEITYEYIIEN